MKVVDVLIVTLLFFVVVMAGVVGYLIGYDTGGRKAITDGLALRPGRVAYTSLAGVDIGEKERNSGYFCANFECTQVGLRGTINSYDPSNRLVTLKINEGVLGISLTNTTVIDSSHGISFFEETYRLGDLIVAIFNRKTPLLALEAYFDKTGSIARKKANE